MDEARMILLGVAAPVALCAAVLAVAYRVWRREAPGERGGSGAWAQAGGALALGLAIAPAVVAADAWSGVPPAETWHWIGVVAAAAAVVGMLDAVMPAAARWPLRIALALLAGWVPVGHWMTPRWLWRVATAASILLVTGVVDASAQRARGASVPAAVCVAAALASVTVLALHNLKLALIGGAIAAALGVTAAMALWRPRITLAGGAATVAGTMLPALLMTGYFQAQDSVPRWTALLATAAPAALLLGWLPAVTRGRPWLPDAIRIVAVAIPAAVAAAVAMTAYLRDADL